MKRKLLTLLTTLSMCCLVACGGETTNDTGAGGNNDKPVVTEVPVDEPEVTPAPADEPITEVTPEPTAEPTPEPTAEPTADPVEELTALRDAALAEQDAIEEVMQAQIDLVYPLLEVVKTLPNFKETAVYTNVALSCSDLESFFAEGDINDVVLSYNFLIYSINLLISDYPEITETEEFQNLLNAPTFDMFMYELNVTIYNDTLANTAASGFEKLPYCLNDISSIEY